MNILFICTGNTCRSPMAEHLLRKMLKDEGLENVQVSSAGTHPAFDLEFPDEAKAALAHEGVEKADHKPREVDEKSVHESDLIIVMEDHHKSTLLNRFPQAVGKVHLITSYAGFASPRGITDPYGQSAAVYEHTLTQIKKALEKIKDKIKS